MLEQERSFFDEHLAEWLERHRGKFVLIKGTELIGVFATDVDALTEGARRFGLDSFLVRPVEAEQPEVSIPALTLGLFRADSPPPVQRSGSGT